jgi:peptidoglycan-associated lipoprotein
MQISRRMLLLGLGAASLAGCAHPQASQTLGVEVDRLGLGAATDHNLRVQTGAVGYAQALGQRFAAEVPSTVNFAFDSAALDAEAQAILARQAHWIRQFPEVTFRVYGHTDLVGSARYNHDLGLRGARAVVDFLVRQGVSRSRLEALVSHGQTRPVIPTPHPERRNRRTVTEVSGFVRRHPTVMDGRYAQIVYREYVESATWIRPPTYQ